MADVNISKVYLLNVPLENDYKHTLYFDTPAAQYNYFYGKRVSGCEFTDFSYQRKDGFIRVPIQFETLMAKGVNYVMYQNTAYKQQHTTYYDSDRWFFAFVTDIVYKDDGRTDVYIETDVMQTWMFDITVKPSFVEREHCSDDAVGLHTYPEQLETGEYVCNSCTTETITNSNLHIVMGVTATTDSDPLAGQLYNGIYSGVTYFAYVTNDVSVINDELSLYQKGAADAVVCLFLAPDFLCPGRDESQYEGKSWTIRSSNVAAHKDHTFTKHMLLRRADGSTVKNKKLYTYPYNYLLVDNNAGSSAVYCYEYFENNPEFRIYGALTPGCSIKLIPKNYKGTPENEIEGLMGAKFPVCAWTSDVYTNWITQNGVNIGVQLAGGAAQIIGGALIAAGTSGLGAGVGAGTIMGGVSTIASTIGQISAQSMQPPQAQGNLNSGDATTAYKMNRFFFRNMSIKPEFVTIIDDYFTMFGYKTCQVKTPAKNHRPYFWYTKTIDVSIDGSIPNKDMQKIKDCYNNGITFWKNASKIGDYSVDNSIN